jgi:hypothetical protein
MTDENLQGEIYVLYRQALLDKKRKVHFPVYKSEGVFKLMIKLSIRRMYNFDQSVGM